MAELIFYKKRKRDKIFWVTNLDVIGNLMISFDGKTVINIWSDYHNLPPEQKELFDKENPFWKDFFKGKKIMSILLKGAHYFICIV